MCIRDRAWNLGSRVLDGTSDHGACNVRRTTDRACVGGVDVLRGVFIPAGNGVGPRDLAAGAAAWCGCWDGLFGESWNPFRIVLFPSRRDVCDGDRDGNLSVVCDVAVRRVFRVVLFLRWSKVLSPKESQSIQPLVVCRRLFFQPR